MSILYFPRLNFRGVFTTSPCTTNNDDVMAAVVERDSDTLGIDLAGLTDDQVMAYLRQAVNMANAPSNAPCLNYVRSGWNLYGDYRTYFEETTITSVVSGSRASDRVTSAATDPIVGQPVALLGSVFDDPLRRGNAMMCDLDGTGLVTTQVYLGGLQIGSLQLNHDTRCYQNWLNFFSTVGTYRGEQNFVGIGCVWQFTIPASVIPSKVDIQSSGLHALIAAARGAAGLAVRFRCFEVEPGLTSDTLAAAYQNGNGLPNPASGYLIGTIGIWDEGEPETETAGRKLTCPYPRQQMTYTGAVNPTPGARKPWTPGPPALVGNAVALLQPMHGVVSVDLIETFPKLGFRNPSGPQQPDAGGFGAPRHKADLGPIQLAVVPADGSAPQAMAAVDYGVADYASYEDFGGIVDLPYDPALAPELALGTLVIQSTPDNTINANTTFLAENPIRVVTDDRALYLTRGTKDNPIRLKVYDRGGPTTADTPIYLYEYFNVILQQVGACEANNQEGVRPNQTVAQDTRGLLRFPSKVTIPAGQGFSDWFVVPIETAWSGATLLAYQVDPTVFGQGNVNGVTGVPTWSYATYSAIRIFAAEDFSALYSNGPLQWSDVYNAALRYYFLIFPAMSTYIQLNDQQSIVSHADVIRQRLNTPDKPAFFSTYNMPATRTMSPAKIKLILDFLDQQTRGAARAKT
jgi:hypothetical protein